MSVCEKPSCPLHFVAEQSVGMSNLILYSLLSAKKARAQSQSEHKTNFPFLDKDEGFVKIAMTKAQRSYHKPTIKVRLYPIQKKS